MVQFMVVEHADYGNRLNLLYKDEHVDWIFEIAKELIRVVAVKGSFVIQAAYFYLRGYDNVEREFWINCFTIKVIRFCVSWIINFHFHLFAIELLTHLIYILMVEDDSLIFQDIFALALLEKESM